MTHIVQTVTSTTTKPQLQTTIAGDDIDRLVDWQLNSHRAELWCPDCGFTLPGTPCLGGSHCAKVDL